MSLNFIGRRLQSPINSYLCIYANIVIMKKAYLITIFLLISATAFADTAVESLLLELDAQIQQRDTYMANRMQRISSLMQLHTVESTPQRDYALNKQLIDEYITFQADSAISYFQKNLELAHRMHDKVLQHQTAIDLAHFYASTGFYYEASQLLYSIDTLSLSKRDELKYYLAQHKLNDELQLYSNDEAQKQRSSQLANYYITRITQSAEADSYNAIQAELWLAMQQNDYTQAASLAEKIMAKVPKLSREWATASFLRGLVAQQMEHNDIAVQWMIRSAIVDMKLGIRDYAAFKSIAEYCTSYDIERSMRYMRVMMEDVQAFNSRLRPWQDAMIWPEIEKGYHAYTDRMTSIQRRQIYLLAALVVAVIALLIYLVTQNRRLNDVREKMHNANTQLNDSIEDLKSVNERLVELNSQITEANGVKEEYIGIFLQVCSEYIDKMVNERRHIMKSLRAGKADELRKELDYSKLEQEELKQLYNLFDSTFLRLYPTFVEELNTLLTEDSQMEIKKGEYLNTQLRIFALIRLGITDTPRIATLLHCSLSTIYNYRSRIRYNADITREEFETRIKTIGSFNR